MMPNPPCRLPEVSGMRVSSECADDAEMQRRSAVQRGRQRSNVTGSNHPKSSMTRSGRKAYADFGLLAIAADP